MARTGHHRVSRPAVLSLLGAVVLCSACVGTKNPDASGGALLDGSPDVALNDTVSLGNSGSSAGAVETSFGGTGVEAPERYSEVEQLIAQDLVNALTQVLDPRESTVQVGPAANSFGDAVDRELGQAGYGVQRVSADQGANFLSYSRSYETGTIGRPRMHSRIAIGPVELSRYYRLVTDTSVRPESPMLLAGSRIPIDVDDSRFSDGTPLDAAVSRTVLAAATPIRDGIPSIALVTDAAREADEPPADGPSLQAFNSGRVEVKNLFYEHESTFSAMQNTTETIDRSVIIFANDSMRLGEAGKRVIRSAIENFQEGTDVVSLVGCSNGYTDLAIGNEGLALGRSNRVAEELIALGISRDKILDEGCWAPVTQTDRFPSRGVVLEVLRRNS